jgi:DNA-directed RNA polymerase specialized sigma24 family protein
MKYKNRVYVAALSFLKSGEEAEDFTHDFFIDLIYGAEGKRSGIADFKPDRGSLDKYINVRLRYRRIDRWRKIQRNTKREVVYIVLPE